MCMERENAVCLRMKNAAINFVIKSYPKNKKKKKILTLCLETVCVSVSAEFYADRL